MLTLDDLTEDWDVRLTPKTEREPSTPHQVQWAENGYVIIPQLLDDAVIAPYEQEWLAYNGGRREDVVVGDPSTYSSPGGWRYATPYMHYDALRRLVCDQRLADVLRELTGEWMGVHLNLTGWVSTERNWHRDQYLNEPYVGGFYAAVWIALDDIDPAAGPFEFIPGSHTEPPLSQAKVRAALGADGDDPAWPTHSERILTPLFEKEIEQACTPRHRFLGSRGDVLIWHGKLLHRGSTPRDPTLDRRALIAHFSGNDHRPDMPAAVKHEAGGWFFPLQGARQ